MPISARRFYAANFKSNQHNLLTSRKHHTTGLKLAMTTNTNGQDFTFRSFLRTTNSLKIDADKIENNSKKFDRINSFR